MCEEFFREKDNFDRMDEAEGIPLSGVKIAKETIKEQKKEKLVKEVAEQIKLQDEAPEIITQPIEVKEEVKKEEDLDFKNMTRLDLVNALDKAGIKYGTSDNKTKLLKLCNKKLKKKKILW